MPDKTAGELEKPRKFRTKSVVKEALRFAVDGSSWIAVHQFMGRQCPVDAPTFYVEVHTLVGVVMAKRGDWIVRGIHGEFYPVTPDIFAESYEPAETLSTAQAIERMLRERAECYHTKLSYGHAALIEELADQIRKEYGL